MDNSEVTQGRLINTYLKATRLNAFQGKVFVVDGVIQPVFINMWENRHLLSHGESLILDIAKEMWTHVPTVHIYDLCSSLTIDLIELTFSGFLARKNGEIERWIQEHT